MGMVLEAGGGLTSNAEGYQQLRIARKSGYRFFGNAMQTVSGFDHRAELSGIIVHMFAVNCCCANCAATITRSPALKG